MTVPSSAAAGAASNSDYGWTWAQFDAIAETRGNALAATHGAQSMTFTALRERALAWSTALSITPGERVLVVAENCLEMIALVPGIWHRGGIVVFVHGDAPARHVEHAISVVSPSCIVTDGALRPADARCFALSDGPGHTNTGEALVPAAGGAAPASILFTSGSTGLPKGVTQSAHNLADGAHRIARLLGYTNADRILCPIPFAFDYGWGQLLSLLMTGVPLVLPSPRNSFGVCAAIESARPTVLAGVPAVLADLVAGLAPIRNIDRSSIRLITNTGSRIPRTVFDTTVAMFPDAAISLNYGLTETYRSASLPVALARSHPDAVGHAIPGVELDVVDAEGNRVPDGTEGEIVHRGAGTFLGYWNDPERTERVLRPDPRNPEPGAPRVVFTGDLGAYGADGLLRIHGRRDRQMKSMGVRVSPDEIEAIILQGGLVADAAVISRPHDVLGDMIIACVILQPTPSGQTEAAHEAATLRALKAQARERMSRYMQPRQYVLLSEFPRTRSAKVDYPTLRDLVISSATPREGEPAPGP